MFFIEDLNLPEADTYGVQEVNEVIRISYSTNVYILDVGPSQGWIHRDFVGGGGGAGALPSLTS